MTSNGAGTGTPAGAPANLYTTLDMIKRYLSLDQDTAGTITPGKDDALLTDAIGAFSDAINDYLQWYLQEETLTNKIYERIQSPASRVQIDNQGQVVINTQKPTIQSVTSLGYKTQWSATTWASIDSKYIIFQTLDTDERPTPTSHQIRIDAGSLDWGAWRYPFQKLWFQVTFIGGYSSTPPPIARACTEWIAHDYRLREYIPTMSAGFIGMPMTVIKPSRIPPHIAQILDPWRRTWI